MDRMSITAAARSTAEVPRETAWRTDQPYSLAATLGIIPRGRQDPTARIGSDGVWLAFTTPDGPVTLHLTEVSADSVHARAWGPGAAAALSGLPALLGERDDWSGFDEPAFQATLPRLVTDARRRHPSLRLPSTGRIFDVLVPVVLEQKVTTIEARHSWRYLVGKYGAPAPGTGGSGAGAVPAGLKVAPTPGEWRRIPSWEWHRAGVDPKRSATILRACSVASALERLAALPAGPELEAKLRSVPGIGPWSAAEIAQRTHGDPDSVSVGDFHLASFVGYALTGRKTDDAGMLALLEPWRGHRQRVVRMLGLSGFRKPAFGPRLSPQDHRWH
jgi:3-methyladenine DNA glycosylase/8-oxoguanine DNA glycosylase